MSQKYNPSQDQPPAYGTDGAPGVASPRPAYLQPQGSPYANNNGFANVPPQTENFDPNQGQRGYYSPQPQMGYQQGGYPGGPNYGPGGYQPGYYPQQNPYGPPRGPGGYYDQRGSNDGCMGALLGATAFCCCLDACLLF